jgi:anti-sigma-K factor RskA
LEKPVRLGARPELDALCGEYLVGTLRGGPRRRFERALEQEPVVAQRLQYWQQRFAVTYSDRIAVKPSAASWRRIKRDLALHRFAVPWHSRVGPWRIWALAATVALAVALGQLVLTLRAPPAYSTFAVLQGKTPEAQITVELSADRQALRMRATRPVQAATSQSFELWLIPVGGGAPQSLAVLGTLDSRIDLGVAVIARLTHGTKLAVSVEPAGGSPTGAPTGPVIAIGDVQT